MKYSSNVFFRLVQKFDANNAFTDFTQFIFDNSGFVHQGSLTFFGRKFQNEDDYKAKHSGYDCKHYLRFLPYQAYIVIRRHQLFNQWHCVAMTID